MLKIDEQIYFVLNSIQEGMLIYNQEGRIKYCNYEMQKMTGYNEDELLEESPDKLFNKFFELYEDNIRKINLYEGNEILETVLYRKNKTCFPVEVRINKLNAESEEYFLCTAVDMTRYKESQRKLEENALKLDESMKERDSVVANVTHELRTPVNGIRGNAELLAEEETDVKKLDYLKTILDCCNSMEGIINNLLDFSELEEGKVRLDEKEFSFSEFVSELEKKFTQISIKKGLRFVVNKADDIPDQVIGDEDKLFQIVNNLVSNALKFTSQGYVGIEISLNTVIEDEIELFFMVVDTGIGLSTEDKDKLFKNFSQADSSITRKYGGTGLGLPIAKELVSMMHGKIWADGEVGKGSNFSFTVRLKQKVLVETDEKHLSETWKYSSAILNETENAGSSTNELDIAEIDKMYEKLIISIDVENWAKAEMFSETLKQLVSGASKELQRMAFKMGMSVRKADNEKAKEAAIKFREHVDEVLL